MTDEIKYAGLDTAIAIASAAFVGVYDKGGVPYIMHCLHVMDKVKYLGTEAMIVAVLHDLLEDTEWTPTQLVENGFNPHTVSLIELLTHEDNEPYDDYIKRAALNNITRAIKMEDIRHNSDPHRLKGLREKDFKRLEKYTRAFAYLKGVED
jgi:(p)ppGpp synthase/HD superfamily hydrolase